MTQFTSNAGFQLSKTDALALTENILKACGQETPGQPDVFIFIDSGE